jgi:hypothetical protein
VNSRTSYFLLQVQFPLHAGFYGHDPEKVLMTTRLFVHKVIGRLY